MKAQQAERYVGYARVMTAQKIEAQLAELRLWAQIKAEKPWKQIGQTWEEWAEPNLGYSYKHIDNAIDARITIGEPLLRLLMELDMRKEQIRAMCRAVRREGLQIEGTVIRDGATVINAATDTTRVIEYVERLHTTAEAKKIEAQQAQQEAKDAKARLAEHQELAHKEVKRHHEIVEAKDATIAWLEARPTPIHGATEADRQRYPQVQAQFHEIDFACDRLEAINEEDGHSRGFWRELRHTVTRIRDRLCDLERAVADAHPDAYDSVWPYVPDPATELPAAAQAERMLREAVDTDGAGA